MRPASEIKKAMKFEMIELKGSVTDTELLERSGLKSPSRLGGVRGI